MGDLKVGEAFEDRVYIVNSVGTAQTGLSPTCTIIDEGGNRSVCTVAEMASGWYKVTDFTPDAAGTWCLEWAVAGAYTIQYPFKLFKVGGGTVADNAAAIAAVNTALTFQHQTDAYILQSAPVQNTWYTVLDTAANVRVYAIWVVIATTGETLETRITVDGITCTMASGVAASANQPYFVRFKAHALGVSQIEMYTSLRVDLWPPLLFEGRSVKVEIRKTSASGTGDFIGKVVYAKR